jgi:hypothetical protein
MAACRQMPATGSQQTGDAKAHKNLLMLHVSLRAARFSAPNLRPIPARDVVRAVADRPEQSSTDPADSAKRLSHELMPAAN